MLGDFMKVILATNNQNKAREIREIIGQRDVEIFTLSDLGIDSDPEETGKTFLDNATIKVKSAQKAICEAGLEGYAIAADDSGLCVDALDGGPGVYSARYAEVNGRPCTYADNNKKLLDALKDVPEENRGAHFETVAVLINVDGSVVEQVGKLEGKIGFQEIGTNGFGYDPIFYPNGINKTLAELTADEKDAISHRGQAFRKLFCD